MSSQYKENNFSTESLSNLLVEEQNIKKKPNFDTLIKRIIIERKREKKKYFDFRVCFSLNVLSVYFFYKLNTIRGDKIFSVCFVLS